MAKPTWKLVQETHSELGLDGVFLRVLGWGKPQSNSSPELQIGPLKWEWKTVASLQGAAFIEVSDLTTTSHEEHRKLARQLGKLHPELIIKFSGRDIDTWYWPRRLAKGSATLEAFQVAPGGMPDFLAQRLAGLRFSDKELVELTPAKVRTRLRGSVETTKITKEFYNKFHVEHEKLSSTISGLPEHAKHGYATLLLNRLMFIWFLQKKGFLNNDESYLMTCFKGVQELKNSKTFYSFYKDYLLDLFFNHLNSGEKESADHAIRTIIGDVPYINGGIFGESSAERDFEIEIPDESFLEIFKFFSTYTWHLDTRPTGNPSEINPEVIGYIFEQYINFTAEGKKESGAYYTPEDVTSYLASQTIVPKVLDHLAVLGFDFLPTLQKSPTRYLSQELLHGSRVDPGTTSFTWLDIHQDLEETWQADPSMWHRLDDQPFDAILQLEDETWVETFYRRERASLLMDAIKQGEIREINDLISHNLDSLLLTLDLLEDLDSSEDAATIFDAVSSISIIDPACGSGAFLFAAMNVLEPIYSALLEKLGDGRASAVEVLSDEDRNRSYALRKHIALRNLYGTDLMEDAIETAKLRLFLALASTLNSREELRPLPDLDFNLKCGNLVVGFQNASDARRFDGDFFLQHELDSLAPEIAHYETLIEEFKAQQEIGYLAKTEKSSIKAYATSLTEQLNRSYANASGVPAQEFQAWVDNKRPFHWMLEFPAVARRGGFDVIIGNPPYIKRAALDSRDLIGYRTSACPDFYAMCYERSLNLLAADGRHGFIVMLSLSFSEKFGPLRQLFQDRDLSEWWSTYGKRPDQLFEGAQVRNTILIIAPGGKKFSTRHHIMTAKSRTWIFQTLEYHPSSRAASEIPLRGGVANLLAEKIHALRLPPAPSGNETFAIRRTGAYWLPAFYCVPPVVNKDMQIVSWVDERATPIDLQANERRHEAVAAMIGKLGYLYWQSVGDDFDVVPGTTKPIRALAAQNSTEEFKRLSLALEPKLRDSYFASLNAGKLYLGLRLNQLRHLTDETDLQLLRQTGLEEHWRALNIWYRQTMKATKENSNSSPVPAELIEQVMRENGVLDG